MARWESEIKSGSGGSGNEESTLSSVTEDTGSGMPKRMNFKTWKEEVANRLDAIMTFGDFACMTRHSTHTNPGLEVAGSLIPLPLVNRDADTIKDKCEQAPFGRGDDTIVDVSVRKTWQLDANLFRCSNPAWQPFLDTLTRQTAQKLGMPEGIRAVPWKLLLYEEGSFFKPHKDSEKAPGMIGTLVISLPSKHEGGEVHLSHSAKRHVFATSECSGFDLTALAWYSDVTHEIRPLTSGYRLVITYNLLQQGGSIPSAGMFVKQKVQLQALMQQWTTALTSKRKVIYQLDHKYSESSLSIRNMKGRDAQLIRCLKEACQETGLYLFLAQMTRTENDEDDYYADDDENTLELDHVTTLDGKYILDSVDVEMNEILGPDPYEGRDADSVEEGEFTGNEGAPSKYRYHDSAALIVPSRALIDLALSYGSSAANLFQMVYDSVVASPGDATARREAVNFIDAILEKLGPRITERHLLSKILRVCKFWSAEALYNKAIRKALLQDRSTTRSYGYYQPLIPSTTLSPTAEIAVGVAGIANELFSHPTDQDWNDCLGELVQGLNDLTSLKAALDAVQKLLKTKELQQSFKRWQSSVEASQFDTKTAYTALDCHSILSLIQSRSNDEEWVSKRLIPKLRQHADKQLLYILLEELYAEDGFNALKDAESLARRLLDATLSRLKVEITDMEPQSQRLQQGLIYPYRTSNDADPPKTNLSRFGSLLEHCLMCGLMEQVMELLTMSHDALAEGISRLPPKAAGGTNTMMLRRYIGPRAMESPPAEAFLAKLVTIWHKYQLVSPHPLLKDLFMLLFTRYVLADMPIPPSQPHGWSHNPRFCSKHEPSRGKFTHTCHLCEIIQDFIRAPDQVQGRFTHAKNIRSHLESVLPRQHYSCATDTRRVPGSSCQTLVVTKIGKDTEFQEDMKIFSAEMQLYEKRLLVFRQAVVQRLLGDETYQSLIMIDSTPATLSTIPLSKKRSADESLEQPVSTRQRTADFIDLTSE